MRDTAASTVGMEPEQTARLELLRKAPLDSWLALTEDESRLVAAGRDLQQVVAEAHASGVANPVVLKTPKRWLPRAF